MSIEAWVALRHILAIDADLPPGPTPSSPLVVRETDTGRTLRNDGSGWVVISDTGREAGQ